MGGQRFLSAESTLRSALCKRIATMHGKAARAMISRSKRRYANITDKQIRCRHGAL